MLKENHFISSENLILQALLVCAFPKRQCNQNHATKNRQSFVDIVLHVNRVQIYNFVLIIQLGRSCFN